MLPTARPIADCPCFRISPTDTNYFVVLADPVADRIPWVTVIEIFERGGKTPPNAHVVAWEQFLVLAGSGRATCGGTITELERGDTLLVPPGTEHVVENTGSGKLYCLTNMFPDENFAALIRAGTPVALDRQDLDVLTGLGPAGP